MKNAYGTLFFSLLLLEAASASTMSYDHKNRLIEYVDDASLRTQYIYDALGRRIKRIVDADSTNPQTTRFLYSDGHALEELDGQDTMRKRYVYGAAPDDVLRMSENVNQSWFKDHFYLKDNQNTVFKLTSNRGSIEESYEYGDYGQPLNPTTFQRVIAPSSMGNEYLFTGRRLDQESGLYYYRLRHMDPSVGQFIQRDPAGSWTDGINLGNGHSYVGNNPQTFTDPSGLIHAKANGGTGPTGPVDDEKKKKKLKDIPFRLWVKGVLSGVGLGFAANVVDDISTPAETLARTHTMVNALLGEPKPEGEASETLKEQKQPGLDFSTALALSAEHTARWYVDNFMGGAGLKILNWAFTPREGDGYCGGSTCQNHEVANGSIVPDFELQLLLVGGPLSLAIKSGAGANRSSAAMEKIGEGANMDVFKSSGSADVVKVVKENPGNWAGTLSSSERNALAKVAEITSKQLDDAVRGAGLNNVKVEVGTAKGPTVTQKFVDGVKGGSKRGTDYDRAVGLSLDVPRKMTVDGHRFHVTPDLINKGNRITSPDGTVHIIDPFSIMPTRLPFK